MNYPSGKQLSYLKGLGYELTLPETSQEATYLIGQLKDGASPKNAEKGLLKARSKYETERLANHKKYMDGLADMNREFKKVGLKKDMVCVGFRLTVASKPDVLPEHEQYINAFIPFDLARKRSDIMMLPGIYAEELVREPKHGKFVQENGSVIEIERKSKPKSKRKHKSGCLTLVLAVVALMYFLSEY